MVHRGVSFKIPERYECKGPRLVGGQGYVYPYRDKFLQRDVAIKEMQHPGDAGALRDELAKISEIRSRHVVEVYELFEAKHSRGVALVEEYVPGQTLEELATDRTAAPDNRAIKVLWQIACGLADIHAHRIIHRDIKPQNIKLDAERVIKILDFGLSSVLVPDAETVAARGTMHYLAPEMYETAPVRLSKEIDVYAFGVTVWFFLNEGTIPRPLRETPPQSHSLAPSMAGAKVALPQRLTGLLDRTLDRDPQHRPSMVEVRDNLHRQITSGQHRLVFSYNGKQHVLTKAEPRATLTVGGSSLTINYDQFDFVIQSVAGEVYLNNTRAQIGSPMPDSFVITFGSRSESPGRTFVPMTVLAPEVVL